jgi:hypothetical protein
MSCYTQDSSFNIETQPDDVLYNVSLEYNSTVAITFETTGTTGSINRVTLTPSGPMINGATVTFGTAHLGTTYTVTVDYTASSSFVEASGDRKRVQPLETPTKTPKFKPVSTCPT